MSGPVFINSLIHTDAFGTRRAGHLLHSNEGVTQGEPLAMIAYGLVILHSIRDLLVAHPQVT